MEELNFENWTEKDFRIYNQILSIFEIYSEEELPKEVLEKILETLNKMLRR